MCDTKFQGWDNSSLVSNVTNIKLPSHLLSSQTTPQQLDIIVRQLSQLQDAKNTQRKLKYLMKQWSFLLNIL